MHRSRAQALAIAGLGLCLAWPTPSAAEPVLVPSGPSVYTPIEKTPVEIGRRYWVSDGETRWEIDSSYANAAFGNPTTILHYEDLEARSVELTLRIDDQGWFFKGTLGGGVRYWEAKTDGTAELAGSTEVKLNEFRSERFGAFADVTHSSGSSDRSIRPGGYPASFLAVVETFQWDLCRPTKRRA